MIQDKLKDFIGQSVVAWVSHPSIGLKKDSVYKVHGLSSPRNLLVEDQATGKLIQTYCFNFFETLQAFPTLLSRIGLENPFKLTDVCILAKSQGGTHLRTYAQEFFYSPKTELVKESIVLTNNHVSIELAEATNFTTTPKIFNVTLHSNNLPFDVNFLQIGGLAIDVPKKRLKKTEIQPL